MKKIGSILGLLLFVSAIFGQTLQDSKDFISEKIGASNPLPNYDNNTFFSSDILREDAEMLVNRKVSDDEFEHLFIYMRDVYLDETRNKWAWTVAECLDIRGAIKVSATRVTAKDSYYNVTIYMNKDYLSKRYSKSSGANKRHEDMTKMEILISDDFEVANNIKKAIIKMGQFYNVSIRDGDKF